MMTDTPKTFSDFMRDDEKDIAEARLLKTVHELQREGYRPWSIARAILAIGENLTLDSGVIQYRSFLEYMGDVSRTGLVTLERVLDGTEEGNA